MGKTDIVKRGDSQLPSTIDELHKFIIIGKEKLKAHKAKIRAIEKIDSAHTAKKAALTDAQGLADIVLEAEAKLGMMLAEIERKYEVIGSIEGTNNWNGPERKQRVSSLPPGIGKKESHQAQTIAKHPEIVEQVKQKAEEEKTIPTARDVYREVKKTERQEKNLAKHSQPFPVGKYAVILADPPWKYDNSGFDWSAESQYPTMAVQEICNLAVPSLCTEETILFLWAVNPLLPEALKVMSAWGFSYKTNLVWIKESGIGVGWFSKSKHELLLIGTRSNTPQPLVRPDSCFISPRTSHSTKPAISFELIESMYTGNKIELFQRQVRSGWDGWGNE